MNNLKKEAMGALRLALTGKEVGLPVDLVINTIGWEEARRRIKAWVEYEEKRSQHTNWNN